MKEPVKVLRVDADTLIKAVEFERATIAEALENFLAKFEMPRFRPIEWSDEDYERVAGWVNPMRAAIEKIKNDLTSG